MREKWGSHEDRMSISEETSNQVQWDALNFDEASGNLVGAEATIRLAPQLAALFSLLALRLDEVVTRREITNHLWPNGRVEFEQGIAFAVREIRKAIDAAGGDSQLLQTIPKRGLRLRSPRQGLAAQEPEAQQPSRYARGGAFALITVAVLFGVLALRAITDLLPVLAIFEHEPGEGLDGTHVAEALGFELTTVLTAELGGRLGVLGPTGTSTVAGPEDTDAVRSAPGACLVISGQIRLIAGDSAVVFTQIVRTSDRVHV
jgi:DNA-binding winged helix-turn-helix (wHTH) protein